MLVFDNLGVIATWNLEIVLLARVDGYLLSLLRKPCFGKVTP